MEDVNTAVVPGPLNDLVLVKAPVRPTAAMIEAANEKADARGRFRQGPEQVWRDMMDAWLAAAPAPLPGGLDGSSSLKGEDTHRAAEGAVLVPRDQLETLRRSLELNNLLPGEGETLINCWIMASEAESKA